MLFGWIALIAPVAAAPHPARRRLRAPDRRRPGLYRRLLKLFSVLVSPYRRAVWHGFVTTGAGLHFAAIAAEVSCWGRSQGLQAMCGTRDTGKAVLGSPFGSHAVRKPCDRPLHYSGGDGREM